MKRTSYHAMLLAGLLAPGRVAFACQPQACSVASLAAASKQPTAHRLYIPTESHTRKLAELLAEGAREGDCICLSGDVGAGKSFFSREFIRAAYGDPYMSVPSPTYLLQNIYDDIEGAPIHHFDLYRLSRPLDLQRVGWADSVRSAVCLVEWPDRLGEQCPLEHLALTIGILEQGNGQRQAQAAPEAVAGEADVASDDDYSDQQPRIISLAPHGSRWQERTDRLMRCLDADEELTWCLV